MAARCGHVGWGEEHQPACHQPGWQVARVRSGARAALKVLAISGSLRKASSNSAVLRLAAHVAWAPMRVELFIGLDALPYFNPDHDRELNDPALPEAVRRLRSA